MLSNQQIQLLEGYCEKMGVKYYDVKQELLDHMCEWVEHDLEESGNCFDATFERMKMVFTQQDFRDMIKSKARAVRRMVTRNFMIAFLDFFSWPKILITAVLFLTTLLINQYGNINKFPSSSLYLFNLINLSFSFGRGKTIYHNRFDKVQDLISIKQIFKMQLIFILPTIIYFLLSLLYLGDITVPLEISKTALFLFPLLIMLTLAWRSASIDANEKIRHDYPDAFRLR